MHKNCTITYCPVDNRTYAYATTHNHSLKPYLTCNATINFCSQTDVITVPGQWIEANISTIEKSFKPVYLNWIFVFTSLKGLRPKKKKIIAGMNKLSICFPLLWEYFSYSVAHIKGSNTTFNLSRKRDRHVFNEQPSQRERVGGLHTCPLPLFCLFQTLR